MEKVQRWNKTVPFSPFAAGGQTALAVGASHGQADLVRLLLNCGVDAGIRNHQGRTPLMLAQAEGRKVTAGLLRERE